MVFTINLVVRINYSYTGTAWPKSSGLQKKNHSLCRIVKALSVAFIGGRQKPVLKTDLSNVYSSSSPNLLILSCIRLTFF